MKFGYRDRIVLLIVVIVLILSIGIFVFIRPKYEQLNTNKDVRKNLEDEWNQKLQEFSMIPKRQEVINTKYQEGAELAKEFTDEMTSVELDKFLQDTFINTDKFREDEVKTIESVQVSNKGTSSLGYYYYTPSIVTYPLYEYADLDGSLKKAANEKLSESKLLGARSAQTVGSSSSKLKLLINREDTMALLDAVNDYANAHKDTMMIESVTMKEYDFNEKYLDEDAEQAEEKVEEEQEVDDDGNPVEKAPAAQDDENEKKIPAGVKPGYTEVSISYRVFYVQAPTKPDVGPTYDESIWEGKEWRTVTAPADSAES
jgi:hypothetical protein